MLKKWKTIVALVLMIFAILFEWGWFWAFFIVAGLVHVIISQEIHFVEAVKREETPTLYWLMVVIWSLLAAYSIANHLRA